MAANWELVRLRYESQPVSFGSNTLVGTAGVALAVLAKREAGGEGGEDEGDTSGHRVLLGRGHPLNRRRERFLTFAPARSRAARGITQSRTAGREPQAAARAATTAARRSRPPAPGIAGEPGREDRHPHVDALERGRRAHLGERLGGLDPDPQLLGELALEALERRLAGLGLAAGQVEDVGRRALADQQQAARAEDGGGDDTEHGFGIPLAVDDWRDLGGLQTTDGRTVRPGALVRARSLDDLAEDGWATLHELGVRTLIDLRNDDERAAAPAPPGITAIHVPLDGSDDREFWDEWAADWRFGTPVYYGPHIARFPERSVAVLERDRLRAARRRAVTTAWAAATAPA